MKIFLTRHAEAIDYETATVTNDEHRFITSKGRKTTRKVVKALKTELESVAKIFTSPLIRAVQTAEIFATALKFEGEVEPVNELKNESLFGSLQKLLETNSDLSSVMLTGHEPKISSLVKSFSDKKDLIEFRKSAVCLIDYDTKESTGKFIWYFDPKCMKFIK